jgi:hypothetical protein
VTVGLPTQQSYLGQPFAAALIALASPLGMEHACTMIRIEDLQGCLQD